MNASMTLSASKISEAIRKKKKAMMESAPDMIDTSPTPDMNAQDVYDTSQRARIEETLKTPKKVNADETMADEMGQDDMGGLMHKAAAKAGIMKEAHVPAHPMEMPEASMAEGGMMEHEGYDGPPMLMSKMESDEKDWNVDKFKFKRGERLSKYLDSLDIY
jgi:hypothetical protein